MPLYLPLKQTKIRQGEIKIVVNSKFKKKTEQLFKQTDIDN